MIRQTSILIAAVALTAATSHADSPRGGAAGGAPRYTFVNIADTTGPFSSFPSDPAVNDAGAVSFMAFIDQIQSGVFKGSGGAVTTIVDTSGVFTNFSGHTDINNAGMVAFEGNRPTENGGRGIFVGSGGSLITIVDVSGAFTNVSTPSINDAGLVAFGANDNDGHGIYTRHLGGGPITTIADTSGDFSGISGLTSINASGVVAFRANRPNAAGGEGIFAGTGKPNGLITIAETGGVPGHHFGGVAPSINDDGAATFRYVEGETESIFSGDGGPLTIIVTKTGWDGPFFGFGSSAINNSGAVAFRASAFNSGLFTGPDYATDAVIQEGDSLFGSTVGNVSYSQRGMNANGDIAFWYSLSNGVMGIAVAVNSARTPPCTGDLNNSDAVDVQDLLILLSAWGPCENPGDSGGCPADLNGSGAVDVQDLLILLSAWGPCP